MSAISPASECPDPLNQSRKCHPGDDRGRATVGKQERTREETGTEKECPTHRYRLARCSWS
jgi:hypothetical protein